MSLFKSLFGPSKEEKERLEREEKERLEREEKERLEREEKERLEREEKERLEREEKERLEIKKKEKYLELVREFDKDNNGIIDVVEGDDFSNILKKNQEKIIEINRDYIKQFVQVSNYLKTKRKSLQNIFESLVNIINEGGDYISFDLFFGGVIDVEKHIKTNSKLAFVKEVIDVTGYDLKKAKELVDEFYKSRGIINSLISVSPVEKFKEKKIFQPLNENIITNYFEILKDDIHIYNVILVSSLNMVESLINDKMITFYEIYERFDELNMFDSKYERDIKHQLQNVNDNLGDVMKQIVNMGENIISSINDLSMITEESSKLITEGLESVNSSIEANNLISTIQSYQLYRIGKNTKSLRG